MIALNSEPSYKKEKCKREIDMTQEKSNDSKSQDSQEISLPSALKSLAEVLIEHSNKGDASDLEAFEQYTYTLQSKIQNRTHDFPERFSKGYELLCKETKKI